MSAYLHMNCGFRQPAAFGTFVLCLMSFDAGVVGFLPPFFAFMVHHVYGGSWATLAVCLFLCLAHVLLGTHCIQCLSRGCCWKVVLFVATGLGQAVVLDILGDYLLWKGAPYYWLDMMNRLFFMVILGVTLPALAIVVHLVNSALASASRKRRIDDLPLAGRHDYC